MKQILLEVSLQGDTFLGYTRIEFESSQKNFEPKEKLLQCIIEGQNQRKTSYFGIRKELYDERTTRRMYECIWN